MRNLHLHIQRKIGKERVILLQQWRHMVRKIVKFGNHRWFLLRCLGAAITPVSVWLKNTAKTSLSFDIIRKVEKTVMAVARMACTCIPFLVVTQTMYHVTSTHLLL